MMMKKLFSLKFQHQEPPTFDENVYLANKSELFTRLAVCIRSTPHPFIIVYMFCIQSRITLCSIYLIY